MHRIGLILAWILVASLATGLAWGVLSSADRQVGEAASTPLLAAGTTDPAGTPVATTDSTPASSGSSPTIGPTPSFTLENAPPPSPDPSPTTTSSAGASPTTTTSVTSSTTSTTSTVPSTTSTAPSTTSTVPSTTTSTVPPADWSQSTVPSEGGVVVVGHRPYEVRLESATPNPGFSMDIEKQGPDEVRVEFENGDDSYEVRVRWEGGVLTTEVD